MIRVLRLFMRSLKRIAAALEDIRDLYELDLRSRGIYRTDPRIKDTVDVVYGWREPSED